MLVDHHPAARERAPPSLPLDLQSEPREAHRVISRHHPLVVQREDAVEVCAQTGHEGRAFARGRDAEALVELREIALAQEAVRLFQRLYALKAQLLRQSPLPGAE